MFLFYLITLSYAYIAYSNELTCKTPCRCHISDDKVIDISSVGSPEFPRFYQVFFEKCYNETEVFELFSYNPCFQFDSSDAQMVKPAAGHKPCTGAAACIRTPGGSDGTFPEEHAIGFQSSAEFQQTADNKFSINYTVPKSDRGLIVQLECVQDSKNVLKVVSCSKESIVLKLESKCACPNGCSSSNPFASPSGLSVGSKLLIAFFTILLAYLIVGVLWNYCNGSQGAELIPNIEFWNDLPTLIMEGVSFTCSCCGRQSSYGEV